MTDHGTRPARPAGRLLVLSAITLIGYLVVAVTIGAGFERDLQAAADAQGVGVNEVATSTQAQITHDHALYAALTGAFLFVPPLLLLLAAIRTRRVAAGRVAAVGLWTTVASAAVWWAYVALGLGLFADPDDLPVLVQDFGPLTLPMVTTLSLLALAAVVLMAEAARGAGITPRAARATTVVCLALGVLSTIGLVAGGFADPVPPLVIVPGALVLGIAMMRRGAAGAVRRARPSGSRSPASSRPSRPGSPAARPASRSRG